MNDSTHDKTHENTHAPDGGAADAHGTTRTNASAGDTPQDADTEIDRARAERPLIPNALRYGAFAIIVVGAIWLLTQDDSPPTVEPQPVGKEQDGYRLVTGRVSPPEAEDLSESFVRVEGVLRQQVLQRLAELQAEWKVAGPRVTLRPVDVQGDAVAFAEQLETWLEQHNLLAGETVAEKTRDASANGAGSGDMPAQNVVEGDLPAPPAPGMVIRSRSDDMAIARDLALALAPVIGGEVNLFVDERVNKSHLVVALVGAPRFSEDGVAYFQAQ
jgi:hypothetical protein